ncbi:MAG TPA: adenylate/guanylate cyclase domain-containing protein, partial [Ramlibacter sp.]|nr:adenylate/guanylate cyclase domain-containing protein [Ramlibacter sp.]
QRRTLRMPPLEFLRLVLGLTIPFLLAAHFTGTRAANALFAQDDTYARVASGIWARDAGGGQLLLILAAWTHGCLGLHFAFRHRARWRRVQSLLIALATLLPALAYLGLASMAREIAARPAAFETLSTLNPQQKATLSSIADGLVAAVALALVAVMLARLWRDWRSRRPGRTITITYPGRAVRVPLGYSVLEASRLHGIPHLSLCGGRARCSTCRVRVEGPPESLPAAEEAERRTLTRIAAPPDTRLACQLRPASDITVTPLLAPTGAARLEFENLASGVEREVAILFIDLRRWTTLSEGHLPFDLVYVLDQYFTAVGDAVREAGGVPNQFIGDSVMAIFGLEVGIAAASRQAVAAAAGIERRMALLNVGVQRDFGRGLDFGIGIHAGVAVVGSVGYRETRTLSAVGDAVNTASRLQELTKEFGVNLVLSERVAREAGLDTAAWPAHRITLRGRATELTVYAVSALSGA